MKCEAAVVKNCLWPERERSGRELAEGLEGTTALLRVQASFLNDRSLRTGFQVPWGFWMRMAD